MSIRADEELKVYNYCTSPISLKGQSGDYFIEGSSDGIPAVQHITFRELEAINSRTPVIRSGAVEFDEDKRDEIYEGLHIANWKTNAFFEGEIDELILNPTLENTERIINISDVFTFERIRGHLVGLKNDPTKDVSNRIIKVIEQRSSELNRGKTKTSIVLKKNTGEEIVEPKAESAEVAALKEQMKAMQEMMQQMLASNTTAAVTAKKEVETVAEPKAATAKKPVQQTRGRKKTAAAK